MRKISLALILVIAALHTFPLTAEPLRDRGDRGGVRSRIVRVIKSIFSVRTEGDGLMPPVPAAPPKP
jgi:hypothetical protein